MADYSLSIDKMGMQARLEGADELDKKLQDLIQSLSTDTVEPMLLDAAKLIRDGAKRLAPKGPTGNLRKGIVAKSLQQIGVNPRSALAGINYRVAPHAHLVEFGTVKMSARPFFRPVWDGNKQEIKQEIIDKMQTAVEDSVKK